MTTKSTGAIHYYNEQGGPILRTVTAEDVAALKELLKQVTHALEDILSRKPVRNVDEIILAAQEATK